jgi:NhaP-type Na+/H+ or K+/H+ antiporter
LRSESALLAAVLEAREALVALAVTRVAVVSEGVLSVPETESGALDALGTDRDRRRVPA